MQRFWFGAIGLAATLQSAAASANALDARDLFRRTEAIVQSLFKPAPADHEIIKPTGNIDPRMALMPPAAGTMRLIEPSQPFRQR
jgi:hypothetical protein